MVENSHDGDIVAILLCGGYRLVRQILAAIEWAPNGQLGAQDGEQKRPLGAVSGESSQSELENLDLLRVDGVDGAECPSVVGESGGDQLIDVANFDRLLRCAEQSVTKAGISRLTLRGSESNRSSSPSVSSGSPARAQRSSACE